MKKIESMIPFLKGGVLGFGIKEEEVLKAIEKNKKILACDLIDSISLDKEKGFGFRNKISFRKLRKKYCNKKVDFILVNETEMKLLEKKLLPFYVDACLDSLYIYGDYNQEKVLKRLKRYNVEIKKEDSILIVSMKDSKHNKFKDKFYYIYDCFSDFFDMLTDLLVS